MPNRRSGLSDPYRSTASAQVIRGHRSGSLPGDRLGGVEDGLGHVAEDVLLTDEGSLDVELGELELALGTQVLVPQAAGDLEVAVDPGHHEELLGQLGALGQDVAGPRVEPAGHRELAGTLGGRRPEHGRLDLDEALPVHGRPQRAVDRGPHPEVGLHPGPAQVHEAVGEPHHLVDLDPVVHGEGRGLGDVEHGDRAVAELDLPGRELGVDRPLGPVPYLALDRHDVLAPDVDRARHDALHDAGVVAEVDEGQVLAVLTALGDPAAHRDPDAHVVCAERAAHPVAHGGRPGRRGLAARGGPSTRAERSTVVLSG